MTGMLLAVTGHEEIGSRSVAVLLLVMQSVNIMQRKSRHMLHFSLKKTQTARLLFLAFTYTWVVVT